MKKLLLAGVMVLATSVGQACAEHTVVLPEMMQGEWCYVDGNDQTHQVWYTKLKDKECGDDGGIIISESGYEMLETSCKFEAIEQAGHAYYIIARCEMGEEEPYKVTTEHATFEIIDGKLYITDVPLS